MARNIQLTPAFANKRLTVTASHAVDMPNEVFLYVRKPLNPMDGSGILDIFLGVCGATDLELYPINEPSDDDTTQRFRGAAFDKTYETNLLANDAWVAIQDGVRSLLRELAANDQLVAGDSVTIS